MVIIGLFGSTLPRRNAIANTVAEASLARLVTYELQNPVMGALRAERMAHLLADTGAAGLDGVVFSDVRTYEEAAEIRNRGGVMWFVEGLPSYDIAIQRGDIAVTPTEGGDRHYLDPLEALSETLCRHVRGCHG